MSLSLWATYRSGLRDDDVYRSDLALPPQHSTPGRRAGAGGWRGVTGLDAKTFTSSLNSQFQLLLPGCEGRRNMETGGHYLRRTNEREESPLNDLELVIFLFSVSARLLPSLYLFTPRGKAAQ